jgi:hypothetical protein
LVKYFFIILSAAVFASCGEEPIRYPEGGYEYVDNISKEDSSFWYLPAKDSMPSDDSFVVAYYSPTLSKAFDEPNISLGPASSEIFRFYFSGLGGEEIIIKLTRNEMVVKKRKTGQLYNYDRSQLTDQEFFHLELLDRSFPIQNRNHSPRRQKYLDSLAKIYPQLLDAKYYARLYDKISRPDSIPFTFSSDKYRIATSTFKNWVDSLNASGYWTFPYDHQCEGKGTATHMAGYLLEANTPYKYNIVRNHTCVCDSSAYVRACQLLVKLAGIEKETDLIWGCD